MSQSRASTIRDLIEQDIVTGRFAPGQRLDEVKLAERFGVSRTPIRESLRQLAATDLVEISPYRGVFVRVIPLPEMLNMFEVMSELEGMCARLAARRRTESQLAEIEEARAVCDVTRASGDADEYYYANERFHGLVYAASGNDFLVRTTTTIRTRLKPFRRLQLRVPGRLDASAAEHADIVAAIREQDADRAERIAKSHVTVQGDGFSDFLAATNVVEQAGANVP